MKKYEFDQILWDGEMFFMIGSGALDKNLFDALNAAGQIGWSLVAIQSFSSGEEGYIMQREIEEKNGER